MGFVGKSIGDSTILLNCTVLRPSDIQAARGQIIPRAGYTVVEMQPVPAMSGSILVTNEEGVERRQRPDIGMLIGSGLKNQEIQVGDYVVVDHRHGKHIAGFHSGSYKAKREVRVYGASRHTGGQEPVPIPWPESILGRVNTMKFPVQNVESGQTIAISRRNTIGVHESYVFINDSSKVSAVVQVLSYHEKFSRPVELPTCKTLRVIVRSTEAPDSLEVHCEVVSSDQLPHIDILDLEIPIQAVHKRLFVELDELHDQTEGGILLTAKSSFRDTWVTVLSVGGQVTDIKPGMKVLVSAEGLENCHFIQHLNPHRRPFRLVRESFISLIHPDSQPQ